MELLEEKFKSALYKQSKATNTNDGVKIETLFDEVAKQLVKITEGFAMDFLDWAIDNKKTGFTSMYLMIEYSQYLATKQHLKENGK